MNNQGQFLCLHSFRCSWNQKWAFLWLLPGALPRRDVCDYNSKTDALLRPEPAHPVCAAFFYDPPDLRVTSWLWRKDLSGWVDQFYSTCQIHSSGICRKKWHSWDTHGHRSFLEYSTSRNYDCVPQLWCIPWHGVVLLCLTWKSLRTILTSFLWGAFLGGFDHYLWWVEVVCSRYYSVKTCFCRNVNW